MVDENKVIQKLQAIWMLLTMKSAPTDTYDEYGNLITVRNEAAVGGKEVAEMAIKIVQDEASNKGNIDAE